MLATLSSILQRRQNLIKPLIALSNNSNNLEVGSYCFNKCKWHSLTGRCNWIFLINLFAEWSHDWLFRLLTYREFFYIQMEKYARQALSEGVKSETELHVTEDSELYRVINVHYNRNNHIEVSLVKKYYFLGVYWFTWSGKARNLPQRTVLCHSWHPWIRLVRHISLFGFKRIPCKWANKKVRREIV